MLTKKSKPLSFTDKNGRTTEFNSGTEMYLYVRKHHPNIFADAEKGVDYSVCDPDYISTPEDIQNCYHKKN